MSFLRKDVSLVAYRKPFGNFQMTNFSTVPKRQLLSRAFMTSMLAISALLTGCSMEFINAKPARELKPPPAPVGDLYAGWRVFQDKCASCHGTTARGTDQAPDLLPIVGNLNTRQFAELVLKRYDLGSGLSQEPQDKTTLETRIEEIMRGNEPPIKMPAWQGEPAVNAHVLDLYEYLSARAEGRIRAERPKR